MSVKLNAPKALNYLHTARMALLDAMLAEPNRTIEVGTCVETGEPVCDDVVPVEALAEIRRCLTALEDAEAALGKDLPDSIATPLYELFRHLGAADDYTLLHTDWTDEVDSAADSMDDLFDDLRALTPLFPKAEARLGIAEANA